MIIKDFDYVHSQLERAILKANKLLLDPQFYEAISNKPTPFDYATCTPQYIAEAISSSVNQTNIYVRTYYKRFSKALAYFDPSEPNVIYINTAKLGRSDGSIGASCIHELVHAVDDTDIEHSFGHGDNSSYGKENSAPYWIDNLAAAMIDALLLPNYNNTESSNIVYRKPLRKRIRDFFIFWR